MVLVEICAGSAALTRRLLRLGKLVGFMGSKGRYVDQVIEAWGVPVPDHVVLNDPGYWGVIWDAYHSGRFPEVAEFIECWEDVEARDLFDFLKKHRDEGDPARRAATRLCLIASTYGGGEIGGFKGKHKLRPMVDGFIPSRKNLAKRVREFLPSTQISATSQDASLVSPIPGSWLYIDPPYEGQSGYENTLSREQVLEIARRWLSYGCKVAISESVPLDRELGDQWRSKPLLTTSGQYRKNAVNPKEFLTWSQP